MDALQQATPRVTGCCMTWLDTPALCDGTHERSDPATVQRKHSIEAGAASAGWGRAGTQGLSINRKCAWVRTCELARPRCLARKP
jgi:hypothetical protein